MRHLIIIAAAVCCTFCGSGPQQFTLSGTMELRGDDTLVLSGRDGTQIARTEPGPDGAFTLSGTMETPGLYQLKALKNRITIPVYLEGGEYTLDGDRWSYRLRGPAGSIQERYVKYLDERQQLYDKQRELGQLYENAASMNDKVAVGERMDTVNMALDEHLLRGIEEFNDTELGPYIAHENLFMLEVDFRTFQKVAEILSRNDTGSPLTAEVIARFREVEGARLSGTAPDFELPDLNGNTVKLSSLRGQYVLLDFWASWCAPCRKKNKLLVKHLEELERNNVKVVSLSLDDDEAAWRTAVAEDNVGWLQLVDLSGFKPSQIREQYKVTNVPTVFLIDPEGEVVAINPEIGEILQIASSGE